MKLSLPILLGLASTALARWPEAEGNEIRYSTVRGYFLQDEPDTNPATFDYVRRPLPPLDTSPLVVNHADWRHRPRKTLAS